MMSLRIAPSPGAAPADDAMTLPATLWDGWCLVAFERELAGNLTPAVVGTTRLAIVRTANGIRVFDADCPHRGANLACGGRLEGERIVCPFHGYRIGLGSPAEAGFRVREYPSLVVSGLVFVRLSDEHEHGLTAHLEALDRTHYVAAGFTIPVRVGAAWVTENGLDNAHFREVHGIGTRPGMEVGTGEHGELTATGAFELPHAVGLGGRSDGGPVQVSYEARVFSPWLIVSAIGGARPYVIVTGATPLPDDTCVIRLALVAPPHNGAPPTTEWCQGIMRNSRDGLEKDRLIWESLSPTAPCRLTPQDAPVLAFRAFCRRFQPPSDTAVNGRLANGAVPRGC